MITPKKGCLSISVLLAVGTLAAAFPTRADISSGLVAHYPFAADANDASGNGNNGTVVGAVFANAPGGVPALHFAGDSSTYVVVPRSASLEPTNALSIAMWCYGVPGEACGDGWGVILRKADNCSPGYFFKRCLTSSFYIDTLNPCVSGGAVSVPFAPFTGTNWQFVVGVYSESDGTIETYENGVLLNQTAYSLPLYHSGDLYIGGAIVAPDDGGFNGFISDVRIYNRALSAADVAQLYAGGLTTTTTSTCPNLLGTWKGQMNVANAFRGYSTTPLLMQVTDQSTNGCLIRGFLTTGSISNSCPNTDFGRIPCCRSPFTGVIPDGSTVLLNIGGPGTGRASAIVDMSQSPPVLTKFVFQPADGNTFTGDLTLQPSAP